MPSMINLYAIENETPRKASEQKYPSGDRNKTDPHFTSKIYILFFLLSIVILIGLGWYAWNSFHRYEIIESNKDEMAELRGTILYFDEVLTMSARMAAATGDLKWENRYRKFEPQLDNAINKAKKLAPKDFMREAADKTDTANIKLVAMENESFSLVRRGNQQASTELLYSREYERQKSLYKEGMEQYITSLQKHIEIENDRIHGTLLIFPMILVLAVSLIVFGCITIVQIRKHLFERKQIEKELEYLAKFPSENPNPVLRITQDGQVLYSNEAGKLLLCKWESDIGKAVPEKWRSLIAEVFASEKGTEEEEEEEGKIFSLFLTPVKEAGYVNLYATDITEKKRADLALNFAKEEAEAANKAKSQFLANMSHEIRTPMNAIMGFSDLLAEEELAEAQKEYVDILQTGCNNLMQIIGDILDFSKIEAGKLEVEMISCSLDEILSQTESLVQLKALEKSIDFKINTNKDVPEQIHTDPVRLSQCLINLASNAVKFTKEGHVHINVSQEESEDRMFVRFDVEDTGIGIPTDKQDAIFESFTQADGGTTRKYGGTGLGLAITKQLAGLLGGELTLTSQENIGSVFSIAIPIDKDDLTQPQSASHESTVNDTKPDPSEIQMSGKILVAEDSVPNQTLIRILLEKTGLEVTVVEDGSQAVQEALNQGYDLILMDMQMPVMNGYEATRVLRKEGITIPILALTASTTTGSEKNCFDAGCDDYLGKPIDRNKLLEALQEYLSRKVQV